VIALLSRQDVMAEYNRQRMKRLKQAEADRAES
jgi:hypothetical protein